MKSVFMWTICLLGITPGLVGCDGGDSTTQDTDPVVESFVGDWQVDTLEVDGDVVYYPSTNDDGETTSYMWSFTDEPRGVLSLTYGSTTETYDFVVDVFTDDRWMLEIEDAGHDMVQDCTVDGDAMSCVGSCDGSPGCNWTLSRVDQVDAGAARRSLDPLGSDT